MSDMSEGIEEMGWSELQSRWHSLGRYPPCPSSVRHIDLVLLDANIAGYLTRYFKSEGKLPVYEKYRLGLLHSELEKVIPDLTDDCLERFAELEGIVKTVLR